MARTERTHVRTREDLSEMPDWMKEKQCPHKKKYMAGKRIHPKNLTGKEKLTYIVDEVFFVDLPGKASRAEIFRIHLAKRKRDPSSFDIDSFAAASDGFSGAEIEQAIISALFAAFAAGSELTNALVIKSLKDSVPISVTMAEQIADLRAWAEKRARPAS